MDMLSLFVAVCQRFVWIRALPCMQIITKLSRCSKSSEFLYLTSAMLLLFPPEQGATTAGLPCHCVSVPAHSGQSQNPTVRRTPDHSVCWRIEWPNDFENTIIIALPTILFDFESIWNHSWNMYKVFRMKQAAIQLFWRSQHLRMPFCF